LRVVTNPGPGGDRFTIEEAVAVVDQWRAQPNVRLLAPGEQHWTLLKPALLDGQARGAPPKAMPCDLSPPCPGSRVLP
jgi:hypothetical protein